MSQSVFFEYWTTKEVDKIMQYKYIHIILTTKGPNEKINPVFYYNSVINWMFAIEREFSDGNVF